MGLIISVIDSLDPSERVSFYAGLAYLPAALIAWGFMLGRHHIEVNRRGSSRPWLRVAQLVLISYLFRAAWFFLSAFGLMGGSNCNAGLKCAVPIFITFINRIGLLSYFVACAVAAQQLLRAARPSYAPPPSLRLKHRHRVKITTTVKPRDGLVSAGDLIFLLISVWFIFSQVVLLILQLFLPMSDTLATNLYNWYIVMVGILFAILGIAYAGIGIKLTTSLSKLSKEMQGWYNESLGSGVRGGEGGGGRGGGSDLRLTPSHPPSTHPNDTLSHMMEEIGHDLPPPLPSPVLMIPIQVTGAGGVVPPPPAASFVPFDVIETPPSTRPGSRDSTRAGGGGGGGRVGRTPLDGKDHHDDTTPLLHPGASGHSLDLKRSLRVIRAARWQLPLVATLCALAFFLRAVMFSYRTVTGDQFTGLLGKILYPWAFYNIPDFVGGLLLLWVCTPPRQACRSCRCCGPQLARVSITDAEKAGVNDRTWLGVLALLRGGWDDPSLGPPLTNPPSLWTRMMGGREERDTPGTIQPAVPLVTALGEYMAYQTRVARRSHASNKGVLHRRVGVDEGMVERGVNDPLPVGQDDEKEEGEGNEGGGGVVGRLLASHLQHPLLTAAAIEFGWLDAIPSSP